MLEKLHERTVHFDECNLRESKTTGEASPEELRMLRGSSRRTKNIALIVALRRKSTTRSNNRDVAGYIVATTHLFWHPRYIYERVRCVIPLLAQFHLPQLEMQQARHYPSTGNFSLPKRT
jgi:RNA exonuclease NGL2